MARGSDSDAYYTTTAHGRAGMGATSAVATLVQRLFGLLQDSKPLCMSPLRTARMVYWRGGSYLPANQDVPAPALVFGLEAGRIQKIIGGSGHDGRRLAGKPDLVE